MTDKKRAGVAMVVGVGPALGRAIARRFANEGYAVGVMARTDEVKKIEIEIVRAGGMAHAVVGDATQPESVRKCFADVVSTFGPIDVLVYNASASFTGGLLEISPERFEQAWKGNCFGAFLTAQQVAPGMVEREKGTILYTGATTSLRSAARYSCVSVGKFGLRALSQSLARELGPQGVHVAHVIVDGVIDSPRIRAAAPDRAEGTVLSPDALADTYWQLHAQPPTVWTQELDVRPAAGKF